MVSINLLPQKKKRIGTSELVIIAIGFLWLVVAGFLGWMYVDTKQEIASLKQRMELKEKRLASTQQKQTTAAKESTLDQYLLLSEKLQHLFYPPSLVMDELARNLPMQGKLSKVSYHLDGKATVEGKFEQYEDIASYLHNLQNSPYVLRAEVKSIAKIEVKWAGPVDENGRPESLALQTVGDKLLPRASAVFEILINTFDLQPAASSQTSKP